MIIFLVDKYIDFFSFMNSEFTCICHPQDLKKIYIFYYIYIVYLYYIYTCIYLLFIYVFEDLKVFRFYIWMCNVSGNLFGMGEKTEFFPTV